MSCFVSLAKIRKVFELDTDLNNYLRRINNYLCNEKNFCGFTRYFGSMTVCFPKLCQMLTHSLRMMRYFRASVRFVLS